MSETIIAYLRQKGAPVSSEELARAALNITNASQPSAAKLIHRLLQNEDRVQRVGEDHWVYVCPPTGKNLMHEQFLLVTILPQRVPSWHAWQQVGFVELHGTEAKAKHLFILAKQAEWLRLVHFLRQIPQRYGEHIIVFDGLGNQLSLLLRAIYQLTGGFGALKTLTLQRVASWFEINEPRMEESGQLSFEDGLPQRVLSQHLDVLCERLLTCLRLLAERQVHTLKQLDDFIGEGRTQLDFSNYAFTADFLRTLPKAAGVYIMLNREGHPIYVGKAKNLHRRIRSYFQTVSAPDEKLAALRGQLYEVRTVLTGSELEALLLEAELIALLQPPINRQTKIASRPHRRKSRYPRIILLPAADPQMVIAYFLHPRRGLLRVFLSGKEQTNSLPLYPALIGLLPPSHQEQLHAFYGAKEVLALMEAFYFNETDILPLPASTYLAEIAFSWISTHEECVNSIDIRQMVSPQECLRLLLAYVRHILKSTEKVILH